MNSLELEEFITAALKQVARGVAGSAAELDQLGVTLNPDVKGKAEDLAPAGVVSALEPRRKKDESGKPRKVVVRVKFNLAVTVERSAAGEVKLGVVTALLGVGAGAKGGRTEQAEHRVEFEVPLLFPSFPVDA